MNRHAPYTGFGDEPNTAAKFTLLSQGGKAPAWEGGPRLRERKIPGSTRVNVRTTGRDPYVMTAQLRFATIADYEALDAMQGTTSTLRYLYGVTPTLGGRYEYMGGDGYLVLPNVRLMSLTTPVVYRNGSVVASATFSREAVPQ